MKPLTAPERVPMPGDCHPAYTDDKQLLRDWLADGKHHLFRLAVRLPRVRSLYIAPTATALPMRTFTRREAAAAAPYVGRPFRYLWRVATDDLGRSVAGDAERQYYPDDPYQPAWPDLTALPLVGEQ